MAVAWIAIRYWSGGGVGLGSVVTVRASGPATYSLTWMARIALYDVRGARCDTVECHDEALVSAVKSASFTCFRYRGARPIRAEVQTFVIIRMAERNLFSLEPTIRSTM